MNPDLQSIARARARWLYRGDARPVFADQPLPGQESVWDYPRPPRIESGERRVRVEYRGALIAESSRALRILETASPPTFYLPLEDVSRERLVAGDGESHCEWKGVAQYHSLQVGDQTALNAAWCYPDPYAEFELIRDYISFYPARVACWLDQERVRPQPGSLYGGWLTDNLAGPFKGDPGSQDW